MTERITALRSFGSARTAPRLGDATIVAGHVDRLVSELFDADMSIHATLCARAAQCKVARDDFSALAPNPALNRCLGRLVEIARGQFGREWPEPLRGWVAHALWRRITRSPALTQKAHEIRRIAARAETQLELHHCAGLLRAWAARSAETASAHTPADALRKAFAGFPYYDNYAHLVAAELALLASARRRFGDLTIAVCGCGPLPLSGLMLQLATSARVVLIDRDARALAGAQRLVRELARIGVLSAAAFGFVQADAGALEYGAGVRPLACDVVLVASLVPDATKLRIAQRVSARATLLVRSAAGLCAELAYEPIQTERFRELGLVYFGESVPRHPAHDRRTRHAWAARRELRVTADASVLNTSELYLRP